jgi:outer membrane protein OmpA-like peptidoglycan-associated protein
MQTPHRAQRVSTIDTDLATTRGVRRVRHARSIWQPIWALLAASVLVASGCQREDTPKNTAPLAETPARAPFDAHLTLANNGGRIDYSGEVDTAAAETALEDALRKAYSGDRATGVIDVVTAARPSAWATGLEPLLRAFEPAYGAALRFEGDRIVLSGQADEATRAKLREAARLAFPNAILDGLLAETEKSAELEAIASAPNPDAVKLTRALNQMPVRFEEGKGNVSEASLTLVSQAAKAIAAAPAGTRLLIVGPVVASKDADNDVFLSKQRAEALKAQLILSGVNPGAIETRGWGQNPDGSAPETALTPPTEGAAMRFELVR